MKVKRPLKKIKKTKPAEETKQEIPQSPMVQAIGAVGTVLEKTLQEHDFRALHTAEAHRFVTLLGANPNMKETDPSLFHSCQFNIAWLEATANYKDVLLNAYARWQNAVATPKEPEDGEAQENKDEEYTAEGPDEEKEA